MKRFVYLILCSLLSICLWGQTDIEKNLKEKYDLAYLDSDGKWYNICKDHKYGICNLQGEEIIPPVWDMITIRDTHFRVEKDGKKGLRDFWNNEMLACKYDIIYDFRHTNGYWEIAIGDKWGLCDTTGVEVIPCQYPTPPIHGEGLFLFNKGGTLKNYQVEGGKWGYLDIQGKEVIPAQYDAATVFTDGVAQVSKDGVTSLIQHPLTGTSLQLANIVNTSKIDTNIPQTNKANESTFVFVLANENYIHFSGADYSINDGKSFCEYSKKTLGVPEKNVRYYEDATFGNIQKAISQMKDIAEVYDGEAQIIFYFSGLGMTDETTKERYILPSDATAATVNTTGMSVKKLIDILGSLNTQYSLLLLDAPFNGKDKSGKMLASARGVQISSKTILPKGNTIVCMGGNSEDNVYFDKSLAHGIFTYSLLETLQTSQGNCSLKEWLENAANAVKKKTLDNFGDIQKPQTILSEQIQTHYQSIRF